MFFSCRGEESMASPPTRSKFFNRETDMASSSHLAALAVKHKELENLIALEHSRPLPDEVMIAQFKKQKLKLKETIVRVQG
jgi:hypothetical protein